MVKSPVPRLYLGAADHTSQTFSLAVGLVHELRRRKVSVSVVMVGAHFQQAYVLRHLSGRYVRTLEPSLLTSQQMLETVVWAGRGADLVLIVGQEPLLNGVAEEREGGTERDLLDLLECPLVLEFPPGTEVSPHLLASVIGYKSFEGGGALRSVLLPRLAENESALASLTMIEQYLTDRGAPVSFGFLGPFSESDSFPAPLIDQKTNRSAVARSVLVNAADWIADELDLDRLVKIAEEAPPIVLEEEIPAPKSRLAKIAIAEDSCFGLCFQDNLDILRYYGAELTSFSPLADNSLPKSIGGVYFPGGYLFRYGEELSRNSSLFESLRQFVDSGGVLYSEGAGSALLCDQFEAGESRERFPGAGILPGESARDRVGFERFEAISIEDSILGDTGTIVKGVSAGDFRFLEKERMPMMLQMNKFHGDRITEGYSPGAQVVNTFGFLHFGSNPKLAKAIVEAASVASVFRK